ncbi:MAG: sugar transferase [Candidatus Paceibacteria bacterium]
MHSISRREWAILVAGDLVALAASLWLTLLIRYLELPSRDLFVTHLIPFSILAVVWIIIFVIFGLYEKHTTFFKLELPGRVVQAQVANIIIAAAFFFLIPYFGITPKTNLVIFLIISSALISAWRIAFFPFIGFRKRDKAILVGSGKEMQELYDEVNGNTRYSIEFVDMFDLHRDGNPNDVQKEVLKRIVSGNVSIVVANMREKNLEMMAPLFYNLSFVQTKVDIIDIAELYEEVFERVPLALITHEWFIENIATTKFVFYEAFKRALDFIGALVLGIASFVLYPLVWIAVKLDDDGPLFIVQERVGQAQQPITIAKFRTMTGATSDKGKEVLQSTKQVTRVGKVLRDTRVDELPQLLSVIKGKQSLIGPRPELPELATLYSDKIPHYSARFLVKPGLSGWAQIHHQAHPHHGTDIVETRTKLAYDLYYLKHRSIFLDILIALRTVQILLSRVGK